MPALPPKPMGVIHPAVKAVAQALQHRGWRISRILAPLVGPHASRSHALGFALDACPMVWTTGGFGKKTALLFWQCAKYVAPSFKWFALSEDDHVHLQLANADFVGEQLSYQPTCYYDPTGKQIHMSDQQVRNLITFDPNAQLPEFPIGDLQLTETGDIVLAPSDEIGDYEEGDFGDEEGDYDAEVGKPRRSKGRKAKRAVAKGRAKGKMSRKDFTALASRAPDRARAVLNAAKVGTLNRNDWVEYELAEHAVMIQSALGAGARLKPREITPLLVKIAEFPSVQPRVISMAWNATTSLWEVDVDVALNTVLGVTANTEVPFLGGSVSLPVSNLNKADNIQVTITRAMGAATALTNTMKLLSQHGTPQLTFINGQIISGAPRLYVPTVTAVASTTQHLWQIQVSGLSSSYQPQLRLFTPGDTQTEKFFGMLA